MKKCLKHCVSLLLTMALTLLCGCQQAPSETVVLSKNDGAFDAGVTESAPASTQADTTDALEYDEKFYSTDGTVEFRLLIDEDEKNEGLPVVEVAPHYLSEEDARRVAEVLFGNADMYEAEPAMDPLYSQEEIQEKIARWSQYANESSLKELLGDKVDTQNSVEIVKRFIENYTQMYDLAPQNNPHALCQWQFHKYSYYQVPSAEFATLNTENENDTIAATVQLGDIRYYFDVSTRNKSDFKLNNINAYLYDGIGPNMIDARIFRAWLCRTDAPTDDQISNAKDQAEKMLEQMQLGDWSIDECFVETSYYGDTAEYIIHVNAVPVLNGAAAVRVPQLTNLKSKETYASNYYITDARFEFSAQGDLVSFLLYSPIDIVKTVNEGVKVKTVGELIDLAKSYLELSDSYAYGFFPDGNADEEIRCIVTISEYDSNLMRTKVPETDEIYYYTPAIVFKGNVEYRGVTSGDTYFATDDATLIAINAVDGTRMTVG